MQQSLTVYSGKLAVLVVDDDSMTVREALAIERCRALMASAFAMHCELARVHAELRATQRALAQAEKLRALGEVAASVAHDLRNVLNPLSIHLQVLERAHKNAKADAVLEEIAEMKDVLKRGVRTIDRIRDYGRRDSDSMRGHAGSVTLETKEGAGTKVTLQFPPPVRDAGEKT